MNHTYFANVALETNRKLDGASHTLDAHKLGFIPGCKTMVVCVDSWKANNTTLSLTRPDALSTPPSRQEQASSHIYPSSSPARDSNARFFPSRSADTNRSRNPRNGTVADRAIMHVRGWDFLVQSHAVSRARREGDQRERKFIRNIFVSNFERSGLSKKQTKMGGRLKSWVQTDSGNRSKRINIGNMRAGSSQRIKVKGFSGRPLRP
ncbi:predicted protein [Histoplasma capsulatum G186AR]|uniref:Uncharacterized protein n=1 Tax=Ajellomyces capsulatus (strain G186AR / H82 / ATCC MYA-2454 / RMSCC 2432) TaxID=447093 RepID=C0NZ03_AJECG|nr:uncharacterized protein HCBG_08383 [Histoplasma capsulatum G186AR]EEH03443.1 predicted protein [Histoplasma capsulatum G186AR]